MTFFRFKKHKISRGKIIFLIILLIFTTSGIVGLYHNMKPSPTATNKAGSIHYLTEEEIEFLYDLTYTKNNNRILEQQIFREVLEMIDNAENYILLDFFLFNRDGDDQSEEYVDLVGKITNRLITKKEKDPEINIYLITDPINNFYGSYRSKHLKKLEKAGIEVIITDLTKLRDSNPIYSGFWRSYIQWFDTKGSGWISHPFDNQKNQITLRSALKVLNFKANHRKILMSDDDDQMVSLITSANPHNASSLHSNIAFKITGPIWQDIFITEQAVANFSNSEITSPNIPKQENNQNKDRNITAKILTEKKIKEHLIKDLEKTNEQDEIMMTMFYLSHRDVIESLINASDRGVEIKIILDPNKDAFGREKTGIPNRQVAYELNKRSNGNIKIRWYDTKGEQFHSKMTLIQKQEKIITHGGSANLTRRNLDGFNLETNVKITTPLNTKLAKELTSYFERIWNNTDGKFTLKLTDTYYDPSLLKYWLYRFQEFSGISSF